MKCIHRFAAQVVHPSISIRAPEPDTMSTSPIKKLLLRQVRCSPGGWYNSSRHVPEKPAGQNISFPWGVVSCWAQKRAKWTKKLWLLVYLHQKIIIWTFEIRILAVNPLLYFQVVCIPGTLPKRLRASARQHFPEGTCVPLMGQPGHGVRWIITVGRMC